MIKVSATTAALVLMLFAMSAARALPGLPEAAPTQVERCGLPAAQASLPALRVEACPACDLDRAEIATLQRTYAESAHATGHTIDFLESARVRIIETGMLPNGAPYVIGETAGMRFRVGDPDPGATLGTALGRMTFVILSGAWQSTR